LFSYFHVGLVGHFLLHSVKDESRITQFRSSEEVKILDVEMSDVYVFLLYNKTASERLL